MKKRHSRFMSLTITMATTAVLLSLLLVVNVCSAQVTWGANGVRVFTGTDQADASGTCMASDGAGGAIISWAVTGGTAPDLYSHLFAQRIDSNGVSLWSPGGVLICDNTYVGDTCITADGAGGAIIAWSSDYMPPGYTSETISAQKVSSSGTPLWPANGVVVGSGLTDRFGPKITGDGAGGAIITWEDLTPGKSATPPLVSKYNQYINAQRVDASGAPKWGTLGILVSTNSYNSVYPAIDTDGSGGAVIGWSGFGQTVQRVSPDGGLMWGPMGVTVGGVGGGGGQRGVLTADGAGGAIVCWGSSEGTYAQRVTAAGKKLWSPGGTTLRPELDIYQQFPKSIASDGSGGAFVTWHVQSYETEDAYVQKVSSAGTPLWQDHGLLIRDTVNKNDECSPSQLVPDGHGGVIVITGGSGPRFDLTSLYNKSNIQAQWVSTTGQTRWPGTGLPMSTTSTCKFSPSAVTDGEGGAIVCWPEDMAEPPTIVNDVVAQKVSPTFPQSTSRMWAHDSIGVTAPAKTWYLAEGSTGAGFETWVLVQNPNSEPAEVTLTYMTPAGEVQGPTETLPANSRKTFNVADKVPGVYEVSTKVEGKKPVIAERAVYGNGRTWGTDSIGATAPAKTWYLAEGSTGAGFETWVLVQNPNSEPAEVTLTSMPPAGEVPGPTVKLQPNSRVTVNVSDAVVGEFSVSTEIGASQPVVVERAMYGDRI